MAVVLKQFLWSPNGYDVEILNPGDDRNFGVSAGGLIAEGFVEDAANVADAAVSQTTAADEDPYGSEESSTEAVAVPATEPTRARKRK